MSDKFELNTEATKTEDIFGINIFEESTEPKLSENLPGANLPSIDDKKKNDDEASVAVPKATEIPANVYNQAIADLQKTFKEAAEICATLQGVVPVTESVEDAQDKFTESVIENAIFESFCNGPYFEKASRAGKTAIKDAADAIKEKVKAGGKDPYTLKPISALSYLFTARAGFSRGPQRKWAGLGIINPIIWQMCGVFFCHANEIAEAVEHYKTKFADDLGDLTFNVLRCGLTWPDLYGKKAKGADGQAYILLVDTKRDNAVKEVKLPTKEEMEKEEEKDDKKDEKPADDKK